MKLIVKILTISLLFLSQLSLGQNTNPEQLRNAELCLDYIKKGEKDSCWMLIDSKNIPNLTKKTFETAFSQLSKNLSIFDHFQLSMVSVKMVDNKKLEMYTFEAISNEKKLVNDFSVDISFYEGSNLIVGIQPKMRVKENTASTTKGKETEIEKSFKTKIDKKEYEIRGINIVHFDNNQGLLAIQVLYNVPENIGDGQDWAKKEGIKFAKYLAKSEYLKKAQLKSKELNLTLLDEIGVSFLDHKTGHGINVMINKEDYNK